MVDMLAPGEPAPWFQAQALNGNPRYIFSTVAGRWVMMLLLGSGAHEQSQAALRLVRDNRHMFDDKHATFFGVTIDPSDAEQGRISQQLPGVRWFLDYDRAISLIYGAMRDEKGFVTYAPQWLLLDPMLRVHCCMPLHDGPKIMAELHRLTSLQSHEQVAPVMVLPGVLAPDMCRRLIDQHETNGGTETGFMREENGLTVSKIDHAQKRRTDYSLEDQELVADLRHRIACVLRPMIQRVFQFDATRIERWIVACYDAQHAGHFRAHRDNTTRGTAHRRFAVTINLNAEDYDGGDLCFPEFGQRTYRAPTGGAVVFSCSLLHEAQPVTRGRRYAFLPFLYDDAAARIREQNLAYVAPESRDYQSGLAPQ